MRAKPPRKEEPVLRYLRLAGATAVFLAGILAAAPGPAAPPLPSGRWLAGDLHSHTFLTDGNATLDEVARAAFEEFGLSWLANSEHGGYYTRDAAGVYLDDPSLSTVFLGDTVFRAGHRAMWRWQSLIEYSFPLVALLRERFTDEVLIQGFEWHVPTHGDIGVGIINDEPAAVSDFEYLCDAQDSDTSRNAELGVTVKPNATHADAVACVRRLGIDYPGAAYAVTNHPSHDLNYSPGAIRQLNDAAPGIFFGFEGFPGHQKEDPRGGYGSGPFFDAWGNDITYRARTYGGADYMLASVGGLWDSLLAEGRRFWVFADSDFHDGARDFLPGEYAKTHVFVRDGDRDGAYSAAEILKGMRSGRSFAVTGDLVDGLRFRLKRASGEYAAMGQTLRVVKGESIRIVIRFKSPPVNNHCDGGPGLCDPVAVDHVDLIAGRITGRLDPSSPAYATRDANPSAKVIARFKRADWKRINGWNVIKIIVPAVNRDMYFRLRGTNLPVGTPHETGRGGNPLSDELARPNGADRAWVDLWFYSNPIFVRVHGE